jgi:L-rhamnose mutarotase
MKRIATLTKLKPGCGEAYKKIHDEIWEGVVQAAHEANMRNFTIFRHGDYLFSYYEYIGDDFDADMAQKNALPISPKWQAATGALRELVDGESMLIKLEELWHHDF